MRGLRERCIVNPPQLGSVGSLNDNESSSLFVELFEKIYYILFPMNRTPFHHPLPLTTISCTIDVELSAIRPTCRIHFKRGPDRGPRQETVP